MEVIRMAYEADFETLQSYDRHISEVSLWRVLREGRVFLAEDSGVFLGCLRFGFFWDSIPFLNFLFVPAEQRGKGIGTRLMVSWECEMRRSRYDALMTSTASREYAQHFYEKLGYRAVGGFFPPQEPYELLFRKDL